MPINVDSGVTPLPDGSEVRWSREEVTPETTTPDICNSREEHSQ